jgi:response regulator RpfG family c-di-GMP phosphodiesterase
MGGQIALVLTSEFAGEACRQFKHQLLPAPFPSERIQGNIFQFLTKPCSDEALINALNLGVRQYRLITAERELLEKTLKGSIKILTEILSLANPEAFGRSSRIKRRVGEMVSHLGLKEAWRIETAAMLSQIGCIILPEHTLKKLCRGQKLERKEKEAFDNHPLIGSDLITNIPRMRGISEIILYQEKHFDGSGNPENSKTGEEIPIGARILKPVLDFDTLEAKGLAHRAALNELKQRTGWYDPAILNALEEILGVNRPDAFDLKEVRFQELKHHMVLARDLTTKDGLLLVTKGQEVNNALLQRLKNFSASAGIKEPIKVYVPKDEEIR